VEPGGTRWNQVEPGGTRWNQVEPGGTRWNQVEPGGTKLILKYNKLKKKMENLEQENEELKQRISILEKQKRKRIKVDNNINN